MVVPIATAARSAVAKKLGRTEAARRAQRVWKNTAKQGQFTGEKPSALLYLGVSMLALLKDILDFAGVGSLPGIGTVVTLCFTFLIWILLATFDHSSKNTRSNMRLMRGQVVIGFGLVEAIGFGLNFLPIETAMVIVLYHMARKAWKEEEKKAKEEKRLSARQTRAQYVQEARQARMEEEQAANDAAYQEQAANDALSEQQMMNNRRKV